MSVFGKNEKESTKSISNFSTMSGESIVKHLEPHSLVMRSAICDYCGAKDRYHPTISHLFGIKTCEAHHKWGIRDCEVYMHSHKMVRMIDALKNSSLRRFFTYLEGTFPVRRSNGDIEIDWYLQCNSEESFSARNIHINNIKGTNEIEEWCIPCKNDKYEKQIPISEFLKDDIHSKMKYPIPVDLIQEIIDLLNEGIYYTSVREINEKQLIVEQAQEFTHPNIHHIYHEQTGKVIRCFVPDSDLSLPESPIVENDPTKNS